MRTVAVSRYKLEDAKLDKDMNIAIISIQDPSDDTQVHIDNEVSFPVLRLRFSDLDQPMTLNMLDGSVKEIPIISEEQAKEIAIFVKQNLDKVIIVQCNAGISRSAGIAAAIDKYFTGYDDRFFNSSDYYPNRRCYRLVLNALQESS